MKRSFIPVIFVCILLITLSTFQNKTSPGTIIQITATPLLSTSLTNQNASTSAALVRVVDGDTIVVLLNGVKETVRLIGVDTPETVDPRKPVQCFGKEATAYTKKILSESTVILQKDITQQDKDKYGRLLRYVYTPSGILLNKKIIEDGYGFEYTHRIPYELQHDFKLAQKQARENERGLWAPHACD